MRTCAARIGVLSNDDRNQLRKEINTAIRESNGLSFQALSKMERLTSFIAEVKAKEILSLY